jgi:hypothetical protein
MAESGYTANRLLKVRGRKVRAEGDSTRCQLRRQCAKPGYLLNASKPAAKSRGQKLVEDLARKNHPKK